MDIPEEAEKVREYDHVLGLIEYWSDYASQKGPGSVKIEKIEPDHWKVAVVKTGEEPKTTWPKGS